MRSKFALIIVALFFLLSFFTNASWKSNATLRWDVSGYYLYLPALFIYNDFSEAKFLSEIDEKYQPSGDRRGYGLVPLENGKVVYKFTMGMAVSYLPFFTIGHVIASFSKYPVDGYSRPYQMMIFLGSMLYGFVGLLVLRKALLYYFQDQVIAWVILGLSLGTNLYSYAAIEPAMSHGFLFLLHALIIYLSITWYKRQTLAHAILLGLSMGMAALVRPSEIIIILIPLLWGVSRNKQVKEHLSLLWSERWQIFLTLSIAFLIGFVQLVYWKVFTGHWLFDSYKGEGSFTFSAPHIIDGLFSYKKGWFIYTPLMLFATFGFLAIRKYAPDALFPFLIFFTLNIYLTFSWNPWWYGGSFGMRALVQMYALMSFGLASFLTYMFKKQWSKELAWVLVGMCIYLNIFQTWQYNKGIIHWEEMTREKYWDVFLKS